MVEKSSLDSPVGSYFYPAQPIEDETVINKSRFICFIQRCQSPEEAKHFIEDIKVRHPQAGHHCYAFVAGAPNNGQCFGFSDDGEPGGTAGMPMLSALQGSGLGEICAVTVRYFGGIKLGTGGLQRAYGGSVRQALEHLVTEQSVPKTRFFLTLSYDLSSQVLRLLSDNECDVLSQSFESEIRMEVNVPDHHINQVTNQSINLSAGRIKIEKID